MIAYFHSEIKTEVIRILLKWMYLALEIPTFSRKIDKFHTNNIFLFVAFQNLLKYS